LRNTAVADDALSAPPSLHLVPAQATLSGPELALLNAQAKAAQALNDNVVFLTPPKSAASFFPSADGLMRFLSRFVALRHRHFLTRNNKLRLRYVVPPLACGLLAVTALSGMPAHIRAAATGGYGAIVASLDGETDPAAARFNAMQKRL